jgi:hypothetical protein
MVEPIATYIDRDASVAGPIGDSRQLPQEIRGTRPPRTNNPSIFAGLYLPRSSSMLEISTSRPAVRDSPSKDQAFSMVSLESIVFQPEKSLFQSMNTLAANKGPSSYNLATFLSPRVLLHFSLRRRYARLLKPALRAFLSTLRGLPFSTKSLVPSLFSCRDIITRRR